MNIAAVYCVFNEEEYIQYSIESIAQFADEIIVLLGEAPYTAYNPQARTLGIQVDRTEAIVRTLMQQYPHITLIKGTWDTELEHRNAGMRYCRERKCDYYFLVDGDEVYRADHLDNLRDEIARRPHVGQFIIKCPIFWRGFQYRIPESELPWMPRRLFKITRWSRLNKHPIPIPWPSRFTGNNKTNSWGSVFHISTERVIFYHFSFARTPDRLHEKLSTYSHAHEIADGWFDRVWMRWPQQRDMTNVHPIDPGKFPRIVRHPIDDLPDVMKEHPYYHLEVIE